MIDKKITKLFKKIEKKTFFNIIYQNTNYGGEQNMMEMLDLLSKAVDYLYKFHHLYDGSELLNQHESICSLETIEQITNELEDIRNNLFVDSINWSHICQKCLKQAKKTDKLEKKFDSIIKKKNNPNNKRKKNKNETHSTV
ncbi:hypothetical protein [Mammaliicoccus vitulinus]|uniref:hypothetical protein n=1 Tax=Mammaliicoccus vitulinus TaxID=71237 RepID=UPI00248AC2E1|nr:hypothetical protein [Mammaliicoccus vitulinus]